MELMQSLRSPAENENFTFLGELTIQGLGELLSGNSANAAVFRESGGASTLIDLIKSSNSDVKEGAALPRRELSLGLMQQLMLSSGGNDEDMTSMLELLHSTPQSDLELKADILKTLIACLKESHRCRAVFRYFIRTFQETSSFNNIFFSSFLQKSWWLRIHHISTCVSRKLPLAVTKGTMDKG